MLGLEQSTKLFTLSTTFAIAYFAQKACLNKKIILKCHVQTNTIYDKTFKGENLYSLSTIFIMQGKPLQFAYNHLFQCPNYETGKFSALKHLRLTKSMKTMKAFHLNVLSSAISKNQALQMLQCSNNHYLQCNDTVLNSTKHKHTLTDSCMVPW